jgi:hypothetical protein
MTLNDPNNNGLNSDCPGANATCQGLGAIGQCVAACQTSGDCRMDYACFVVNNIAPFGCLPKAISQCDPTKAASCPRMCPMNPDGGTCFEKTCVNIGDGTVGSCIPGCDPIKNIGCDTTDQNASDCHASDVTGEGLCTNACASIACQNGMPAGSSCGNFFSDCPGGYGCANGKCFKYCNDANAATQCSPGATCTKITPTTAVPTSTVGVCSMSN